MQPDAVMTPGEPCVFVRAQLSQHGLHPRSLIHCPLLNKDTLLPFVKKMCAAGSTPVLRRDSWLTAAQEMLHMSESRAHLLFDMYHVVFSSELTSPKAMNSVNLAEFTLFLLAHALFSPPPSTTGLMVDAVWPSEEQEAPPTARTRRLLSGGVHIQPHHVPSSPSSPKSPRLRSPRSPHSGHQSTLSPLSAHCSHEQINSKVLQHYVSAVKSSIPSFFALLNACCGEHGSLTAEQFDTLRVFFESREISRLSDICRHFEGSERAKISDLVAWLQQNVAPEMSAAEELLVEDARRTTVAMFGAELGDPRYLVLRDCKDAHVYLLGAVEFCHVIGCVDCTIVLGPVGRVLTVEDCESCTIVSSAKCLRISNTQTSVFPCATAIPPILAGDTHSTYLAPYNTSYGALHKDLETARLTVEMLSECLWQTPTVLSLPAPEEHVNLKTGFMLPPEKFSLVCVPFKVDGITTENPFPLPTEYAAALRARQERVEVLRQAIGDIPVDQEGQKQLHAAIQAHFRDWLHTSGAMRFVNDLIKFDQGSDSDNSPAQPPVSALPNSGATPPNHAPGSNFA